jgi:hypothetical protein
MNYLKNIFRIGLVVIIASCQNQKDIQLFDGQTFTGWEGPDSAFRIENEAIIGGDLEKGLEESCYLCTTEEYSDFELTLSVKLIHKDLNGNAGVSFRAKRIPGSNAVASYQADIGYIAPDIIVRASDHTPADMINPFSLWGCLIDENREDISRYPDPEWYPGVILKLSERELIHKIVKPNDWNEIQLSAHGREIEIKINGISTVKFIEKSDIPGNGLLCLQAHQGEPYEVHYKDIRIRKTD